MKMISLDDIKTMQGNDRLRNEILLAIESGKLPIYENKYEVK